ncbi:MAG: hypothetical protein JOZ24_09160 [Candidatus Eremiobacteraeota bacterium]|nr:hypothetical protein [Candidatus Eremiobacteraeota bacterium]
MFEAAAAFAAAHHAFGAIVVACAAGAAATPLLAYALARRVGTGDLAAAIAAFLTVGSRFTASAMRPETFAVDLFALELLVLAGLGPAVLVLPIVALWANLHASAVFAPASALVVAAAALVARERALVRRALGIAAWSALGTLLSPHGMRLWAYAWSLSFAPSPARAHLEAWQPLSFATAGGVAAVLPGLLCAAAFGLVLRRRALPELALAAFTFALTVLHARYAVFLCVAWTPALARALDLRSPLRALRQAPRAPLIVVAPLVLYALLGVPHAWRARVDPPGAHSAAADIIARHRLHGNAYVSYGWAAYMRYRGLPVRVLIDGHGDPYPPDVWNDHIALLELRSNWHDVLERRDIRIVALPPTAPLVQALGLDPAWHRIGASNGAVVLAR